jgi:hypothetical protein
MDVFDEVKIDDLPDETNKISTRCVLSTKTNPDGSMKRKARLVARGFEDLEKEISAVTARRRRMQPSGSFFKFWLRSSGSRVRGIFSLRFCKAKHSIVSSQLHLHLDTQLLVLCLDHQESDLWLGLCTKSWYDVLMDVWREEGLDTNMSDQGVLRLFYSTGEFLGFAALHVDDAPDGGTQALFDTMRKVGERLQIGSEETAADKPEGFLYKGRRVRMEWNRAGSLKEICDHPGS